MCKHLPETPRGSDTPHSAQGDAPCVSEVTTGHGHQQEEENQMQTWLVGVST